MEPESWPLCLLLFLGRALGYSSLPRHSSKWEILEDNTRFTSIMIDAAYGNAPSSPDCSITGYTAVDGEQMKELQ